jgi:hypothetical protein
VTHGAERKLAHELAAKTGFDLRTCLKAIKEGPDGIRTTYVRETLANELAARVSSPGAAAGSQQGEDAPPSKSARPSQNRPDHEKCNFPGR